MKRACFFFAVLIARSAFAQPSPAGFGGQAQPWTYDTSWSLPQTPAVQAVRAALDRGLVGQPGIDFINTLGLRAVFVSAGSPWPCTDCVQWYEKGTGPDGKYQWPAADGPYPQGWEIRWDPNSWVNGQPTRWQFHPFAGPSFAPAGASEGKPPALPAPPVLPQGQPSPAGFGGQAPLPSIDFAPVLGQLAALAAKVDAVNATVVQLAADEAAFRDDVRSQWRKLTDFAVKYVAPIIGAVFAGRATK